MGEQLGSSPEESDSQKSISESLIEPPDPEERKQFLIITLDGIYDTRERIKDSEPPFDALAHDKMKAAVAALNVAYNLVLETMEHDVPTDSQSTYPTETDLRDPEYMEGHDGGMSGP